jgi:hypothetical protein
MAKDESVTHVRHHGDTTKAAEVEATAWLTRYTVDGASDALSEAERAGVFDLGIAEAAC